MAKTPNRIGTARREYAKRSGVKFTQEDAAKEFGVSLSAYRNYEQEVNLPNAGIISKIANKYGVSVDYLLCKTTDPNPPSPTFLSPEEQELLNVFRQVEPWEQELILKHAKMVLLHVSKK